MTEVVFLLGFFEVFGCYETLLLARTAGPRGPACAESRFRSFWKAPCAGMTEVGICCLFLKFSVHDTPPFAMKLVSARMTERERSSHIYNVGN
jgi:hypothetical protein